MAYLIVSFFLFWLLTLIFLLKKYSMCSYTRITLFFLTTLFALLNVWVVLNFGMTDFHKIWSIGYFGVSGQSVLALHVFGQMLLYLFIYVPVSVVALLAFDRFLQAKALLPSSLYRLYPRLLLAVVFIAVAYQSYLFEYFVYYYYKIFPDQDYFKQSYQQPLKIKFSAVRPKNLLLIYVESLEASYQDTSVFHRNLIHSLQELPGAISFEKFSQMRGADWSLGGLIASQCGIPVKLIGLTVLERNMFGRFITKFLPAATCLSDVLAAQHYHNVYMNGASTKFAGFDHFLKTHHYHEIYGREELNSNVSPQELSYWGLPDDILFQLATQKLEELQQRQQPFALTLFTIDTHGVDGHINRTCQQAGVKDFSGIVECSANLVTQFIKNIQAKSWSKDLLIVVTGDHLAMRNQLTKELTQIKKRYIFNLMINAGLQKNREKIFHVDLFPTILTALNIDYPDNRLALGYSGLGPLNKMPQHRIDLLNKIMLQPSTTYDALWK